MIRFCNNFYLDEKILNKKKERNVMFTVFTSVALLSGFEMNIYILDIVFCDIEVD